MARRESAVNDEKLLNEMFVALEYSDTFKEFVETLSEEARSRLQWALEEGD